MATDLHLSFPRRNQGPQLHKHHGSGGHRSIQHCRHPQYLAGVLLNIALPLITRHWLVVILGIIGAGVTYFNTFEEEKDNLQKFGDVYLSYQAKVPRFNFLLGLFRLIRRKRN